MNVSRSEAALLLAIAVSSMAEAHSVPYPKRHELIVQSHEVRLATQLVVHADEHGAPLRERFDADRDGTLDQDEAQQLALHLVADARRTLRLLVDDEPLAMSLVAISDDALAGPVVTEALQQLAAVSVAQLPSPPSSLRLSDGVDEGMRRVPVVVRIFGLAVATTSPGRFALEPNGVSSRFEAADVTADTPVVIQFAR
jgi:hypothetical protein